MTAIFLGSAFAIALLMSSVGDSASQLAPNYEILHSFTGNDNHGFTGDTDGANPWGPLVQAPDGNFYGTTLNGSSTATAATGTIFRMDPAGKITILHHFLLSTSDGVNPFGGLLLARDGNFYGTTYSAVGVTGSGSSGGVIFRITPSGSYTKLWTFTGGEGGLPKAGLMQAKDGYIYGTSVKGGYLAGAVYRTSTNGTPTLVHGFKGTTDGVQPTCVLLQATDGNLYGTAYAGGASGVGTVFKLTTNGGFSVIHTFKGPAVQDGSNPVGGLIQASDGNLYGTTATGGQYNLGTIFKIDRAGTYSVLHSFTITEGASPFSNLLQASDGNLYGTTYAGGRNYGTVFKITLTGELTVLHTFAALRGDGVAAAAGLVQGTDGKLYGTTYYGGTQNKGVVFRLDAGLPRAPTPSPSASPTSTPTSSPTPVSSPAPGPSPSPGSSPNPTPGPGPVCANNTCGRVHGNGKISDGSGGPDFKLDVDSNNRRQNPRGHFDYSDRDAGVRLRADSISCLVITGDHATISGIADVNGSAVSFRVEVDQGRRSAGFSVQLSNGYQRTGVFQNGRVQVEECRQAHAQASAALLPRFAHARDVSQNQLTESNWHSRPSISNIRKIVASVDAGLKRNSYKTAKREFESCGDQYYTLRRIARDSTDTIVWYEQYFTYEDGSYDFHYYYDQKGQLRFVFATARHANGTRAQHRIYFDGKGKRIWETSKTHGLGCPGCFENPYPDEQIAFDPSRAFDNAEGCVEQKPQPRRKKALGLR